MAVVDLSSGKIFGCAEGSKTWYHEKGHLEFATTEWGTKISYYHYFFMMTSTFFIALSLLVDSNYIKLFAFMNALGMLCSYIYEEVWCWAWGLKQYANSKK